MEENFKSASAVLFVIDRFIYWQGLSNTAMKVAKYIENKSADTAIAPQIIIRRIRVMKNDGNIQGLFLSFFTFIQLLVYPSFTIVAYSYISHIIIFPKRNYYLMSLRGVSPE